MLHNIGKLYFERFRYAASLACFLLARDIFGEVQNSERDEIQRSIDALCEKVGKERFAVLSAEVEPQCRQIINQVLGEEINQTKTVG